MILPPCANSFNPPARDLLVKSGRSVGATGTPVSTNSRPKPPPPPPTAPSARAENNRKLNWTFFFLCSALLLDGKRLDWGRTHQGQSALSSKRLPDPSSASRIEFQLSDERSLVVQTSVFASWERVHRVNAAHPHVVISERNQIGIFERMLRANKIESDLISIRICQCQVEGI